VPTQQGAVIVISGKRRFAPLPDVVLPELPGRIDASWDDALALIETTPPVSVVAIVTPEVAAQLEVLAARVAALEPYVPLIAIGAALPCPDNVLPFGTAGHAAGRLEARLRAALRVHSLHSTVMRRFAGRPVPLPATDPIEDASVLLMGRGACFPALSVALGVQLGVIGALSVDAAAKHLNAREVDGIVIGEGFSSRVIDGFLGVLGDDPRFRNLPVLVSPETLVDDTPYTLPYLELADGTARDIAQRAMPLIRLHAFEARLIQILKAAEANGMLDPHTGLLTAEAFARDLSAAIAEAQTRQTSLALMRLVVEESRRREQVDAARIVGRLMRRTDFAVLCEDGAIVVVFTGTDDGDVRQIGRRLASVLRYSVLSLSPEQRTEVQVATATLQPTDTVATLMARIRAGNGGARAVS
jgi:hypothetical protein